LEVELIQEQKPGIAEGAVATAALHLKGVTLRASSRARELDPAINQLGQELTVQVKRHRDKRRKRRDARVAGGERRPAPLTDREAPPVGV
jgi:putative sigma-54 modulation protein